MVQGMGRLARLRARLHEITAAMMFTVGSQRRDTRTEYGRL
jgi:hypothetical protein